MLVPFGLESHLRWWNSLWSPLSRALTVKQNTLYIRLFCQATVKSRESIWNDSLVSVLYSCLKTCKCFGSYITSRCQKRKSVKHFVDQDNWVFYASLLIPHTTRVWISSCFWICKFESSCKQWTISTSSKINHNIYLASYLSIHSEEQNYLIPCWFCRFAHWQRNDQSILLMVGLFEQWETE